MNSDMKEVTTSEFRARMAAYLDFVRVEGGHLWLRHRTRPIAGLVPMEDVRLLEQLHAGSLERKHKEQKELLRRWEGVRSEVNRRWRSQI
ncbi:hypothetical protein OCGS_0323 [Oceaniovalibus guishaninsula JLT2003]|uniref:Antitoxin n=1 Tax=Oceaniovalibus guishaninsula JLT2003 TaxID=1231392 RepID=K2GT41_9RHOB|nr:hypothetical protein [Oceaniovalibus guishaninsula]EKE45706.1 hypothetical protein OCGS_0323 [Oceaniovalibus guishaninsula JLT2003]